MVRTARQPGSPDSRPRRWLFRVAAVLLGLSVFAVAEAVCVLCDWGRPVDYDDPFVGFSKIHPLFVLGETGENHEIPPSRRKCFAAESFPARKSAGTFRIFCLGGSTVQGRPFSKETSLTTWLELALNSADASRDWDVVNCGGISYASYRLAPILEECLAYQPDLFLICTGHNEFLEERTYAHVKHAPQPQAAVHRALSRLRSYTLFREALLKVAGRASKPAAGDRPVLKDEVDALLDYHGGIKAYERDEKWKADVIAHYEYNLRRLLALCRDGGVPALLILPPSNLCDSPPFKSQHRDGLSDADRREWKSLRKQARSHYRDDVRKAIGLLERAVEIDDQHAGTLYELGKCYECRGLPEQARAAFLRARECDVCPLRILASMERALVRVARETGTPLVDAHALLERRAPLGILGDYLLVDHVHPSFRGHQMIADELAEEIGRQGWAKLSTGWKQRRAAAYGKHFASLGDFYFVQGNRTLENLRAWTRGRADGPPIESRLPQRFSQQP